MKNFWLEKRKDKMMTVAKAKERKETLRRNMSVIRILAGETVLIPRLIDATKEASE